MSVVIDSKYELTEFVTEGGEAQIFRARRDEEDAVVKIYRSANFDVPYFKSVPEVVGEREIGVIKKATSDNRKDFPRYVDDGWINVGAGRTRYLVMEPFDSKGSNLEDLLRRFDFNPTQEEAVHILRHISESVDYLHTLGAEPVIHRDLKAGNVWVNSDGSTVLHDLSTSRKGPGTTATNTMQVGSVVYMSPEVRMSKSVSKATDIYGLGMLGKHLLLKEVFTAKDGYITRKDFSQLNVNKKLAKALMKATEEDPEKRYQTVDEFVEAIEKTGIVPYVRRNLEEKVDVKPKVERGLVKRFLFYEDHPIAEYFWSIIGAGGGALYGIVNSHILALPVHLEMKDTEDLINLVSVSSFAAATLALYKHALRPLGIGAYENVLIPLGWHIADFWLSPGITMGEELVVDERDKNPFNGIMDQIKSKKKERKWLKNRKYLIDHKMH